VTVPGDGQDAGREGGRPEAAEVGLVALGGAVGTGLRYGLSTLVPHWNAIPVATLGINLVGAFLLGLLLETLARSGLGPGRARSLRLGLGTGVLGGFTTYSALATDTALLTGGHPGLAIGYALVTVVVGAAASVAGIRVARVGVR
jgi:CrcB protein